MRIGEFIEEVYQTKRIHSAADFEEKWLREQETVASLTKNSPKLPNLWDSLHDFFTALQ